MVHTNSPQPPSGQSLMCIVYHDVKLPLYRKRQLKLHLQQIFSYARFFTDICNLADYLDHEFIVNKLVIIVNGDHAKYLCETVENEKVSLQDPLVYELQFNQPFTTALSNDRRLQDVGALIAKISEDMNQYKPIENPVDPSTNESDIQDETFPFGVHEFLGEQKSFCCLHREELRFVLFQSFIEVLLGMQIDEKEALLRMWISCREDLTHRNDTVYQNQVTDIKKTYDPKNPVHTYTKSSFFFRTVNQAFRCENIERIFDFQPFISHMHRQLCDLSSQQPSTSHSDTNVVRRGKKLSKTVLQQLEDNKGKLISMNGFLSTTTSSKIADLFSGRGTNSEGYQSVVFEMDIGERTNTRRPYADISKVSQFQTEQEVLFFMGFVWHIREVEKQSGDRWKIKLKLSNNIDEHLTTRFSECTNQCTFFTLGKILHELGEYKNAIRFYQRMLKITSKDSEKKTCADIHFHIAMSALEDKSFDTVLNHLDKAEQLLNELPQSNDQESQLLVRILINKGLVHQQNKDYDDAESLFNEALKHGASSDKARIHFYLGDLYFCKDDFQKAHCNYLLASHLVKDPLLKNDIDKRLQTLNQMSVISSDN